MSTADESPDLPLAASTDPGQQSGGDPGVDFRILSRTRPASQDPSTAGEESVVLAGRGRGGVPRRGTSAGSLLDGVDIALTRRPGPDDTSGGAVFGGSVLVRSDVNRSEGRSRLSIGIETESLSPKAAAELLRLAAYALEEQAAAEVAESVDQAMRG